MEKRVTVLAIDRHSNGTMTAAFNVSSQEELQKCVTEWETETLPFTKYYLELEDDTSTYDEIEDIPFG